MSPFRRQVLQACRRVPYGMTVSYSDLARRIGRPRAVRAVGQALKANPWAIIVPCHRVTRQDGNLGGYSAPGDVNLKRALLALERSTIQRPP
ncbi:MAG: MGMT family protein [Gemmatales bacterium]|nr:MGMT family protein [Gemmatales bacterium]